MKLPIEQRRGCSDLEIKFWFIFYSYIYKTAIKSDFSAGF